VTPVAQKTLRRDAARNRARLIASARELFARAGVDVSVEEITEHAGVGMGTLYRHFPTKDDLVDAVLEDSFGEMLQLAEAAAADDDAWRGFTTFLEHAVALHAHHRGIKDVLAARDHGGERLERMRKRMRPVLRSLVERAQAQQALRPEFAAEDLPVLLRAASAVIEATESVAPGYWRRYLALVLDGLRAGDARPLPGRPLTRAQLAQIRRRHA
jgi:AcrR family transcriptional regulator